MSKSIVWLRGGGSSLSYQGSRQEMKIYIPSSKILISFFKTGGYGNYLIVILDVNTESQNSDECYQ